MKVCVKVPATTANIGPGFDCLGMALPIYNTVTIEETRVLEVHVVPTPLVNQFITRSSSFQSSKAIRSLRFYHDDINWGIDNFEVTCSMNLTCQNATYLNAKFKINRN